MFFCAPQSEGTKSICQYNAQQSTPPYERNNQVAEAFAFVAAGNP